MGGLAFRAPVLAALFLIVALATLAMPGSANFVGEFLILLGALPDQAGDRDHRVHRRRDGRRSTCCGCSSARCTTGSRRRASSRVSCRCADAVVIVPLVLAIIAFALYPQGALTASEPATKAAIQQVVK